MALFDSLVQRRQQQLTSENGGNIDVSLNNHVVPAVAGACSPASLFAGLYLLLLCCVRLACGTCIVFVHLLMISQPKNSAHTHTHTHTHKTPDIVRGCKVGGFSPAMAVVDGLPWDLARPLQQACRVRVLTAEEAATEHAGVFLHSAAHVLGSALESLFPGRARLADGPALPAVGLVWGGLLNQHC
jgi:hypothetical protein